MQSIPTYIGDQNFAKQLKEVRCPLSLNEIRAYLMGAILSEATIMPTEAIENIWIFGESEEDGPQYSDIKMAEKFIGNFSALWNELTEKQDSIFRFSPLPETLHSNQEAIEVFSSRQKEYALFLTGFTNDFEIEEIEAFDESDLDSYPYVVILDTLLGTIDEQIKKISKSKKSMDPSIVLEILRAGDIRLEKAFPRLVEYSRAVRNGMYIDMDE